MSQKKLLSSRSLEPLSEPGAPMKQVVSTLHGLVDAWHPCVPAWPQSKKSRKEGYQAVFYITRGLLPPNT